MNRQKYPTQRILLRTNQQKEYACDKINDAPADESHPLEVLIREFNPKRSLDQNALMWAGVISSIQSGMKEQHQLDYSRDAWHHYCKEKFLPDEMYPDDDFEPEDIKEGYQKYMYVGDSRPVLIGSTTQLTKRGFSKYLEKIYAHFAVEYGLVFGVKP